MPKSPQEVPGGVVVWWLGGGVGALRPILVFSLSLSQAQQFRNFLILPQGGWGGVFNNRLQSFRVCQCFCHAQPQPQLQLSWGELALT